MDTPHNMTQEVIMSSKPAWVTQWVAGQCDVQTEALSLKTEHKKSEWTIYNDNYEIWHYCEGNVLGPKPVAPISKLEKENNSQILG